MANTCPFVQVAGYRTVPILDLPSHGGYRANWMLFPPAHIDVRRHRLALDEKCPSIIGCSERLSILATFELRRLVCHRFIKVLGPPR